MSASSPSSFCFAQLSDPHLTSLEGVRWQQLLNKRVLGYLSWRRKRRFEHRPEVLDALLIDLQRAAPEHIVITGDLTHLGLPQEFREARQWLDRLGGEERVTVVPGNHDAYASAPWASTFALWEPYMRSDAPFPGREPADLFPSLRIRDGVALIGLSSACATAPFLATGSLGAAQIRRLTDILRETGEQDLFRIVLLHHPPRIEDEKWRKRLTDGRALCQVLESAGAELVLHGHGHRAHRSQIGNDARTIPVFGIPSASAIGLRPGRHAQYYLYTVTRQAQGWSVQVQVRGYQSATHDFRADDEHHLSLPVISSTSL